MNQTWTVIDSPTPLISTPLGSQRDSPTPSDPGWNDLGLHCEPHKVFSLCLYPLDVDAAWCLKSEKSQLCLGELGSWRWTTCTTKMQPLTWSPSPWASPPPVLTPGGGPQSTGHAWGDGLGSSRRGTNMGSDNAHSPHCSWSRTWGLSGFQGFPCAKPRNRLCWWVQGRHMGWSGRAGSCSAFLQLLQQHIIIYAWLRNLIFNFP